MKKWTPQWHNFESKHLCARYKEERGIHRAPCMKYGTFKIVQPYLPEKKDKKYDKMFFYFHRWPNLIEYLCKIHYLEWEFGIHALRCSKECEDRQRKRAWWHMNDEDLFTYVTISMMTNEHEVKNIYDKHYPMENAFKIKCAYCRKEIKWTVPGLRQMTF